MTNGNEVKNVNRFNFISKIYSKNVSILGETVIRRFITQTHHFCFGLTDFNLLINENENENDNDNDYE